MNSSVILFSLCVGLVGGGLVWWVKRSVVIAMLVPVVVVGVVAMALPPSAEPLTRQQQTVEPPRQQPDASPKPEPTPKAQLTAFRPIEVADRGYVASDACLECHPNNHATWFASYHRTMTQVVQPDTVLGDFNDVKLSHNGQEFHLREVDGVCWAGMLEPTAIEGTPEASQWVNRPIVMSTGSHHMQAYWFPIGLRRTLGILPFVFLKETEEWIPRSAAFLQPPEDKASHEIGRWNSGCSKCHSTHAQAREMSFGEFDTRTAEFGISCEACHGPGEPHIAFHRGTTSGSKVAADDSRDPIVNPDNLSHVRSSQVCGQCHSVLTLKGDPDKINVEGHGFLPGEDLRESHDIWQLHSPEMQELLQNEELRDRVIRTNRGTFYADGVLRVAGREYTSMEQSACFLNGEMGCMSCHQLHQSSDDDRPSEEWANDQLKPMALGNDACTQCHDAQQYASSHTHHAADSAGSSCYNCHMPHTAYGLLKSIRNHTITSPDLKLELAADRPNACNQCHLDKTLQWTAKHLDEWYSIEPPKLDAQQSETAASVLWLLKGNAANRAMAAWVMGWSDAQAVSGDDWQTLYLTRAMDDPYLAVRMIARRSLQSLPHDVSQELDPLGSDTERQKAIQSILQLWKERIHPARPALMIGSDNQVDHEKIDAIIRQRDNTPMKLAE
ncbi:cytochrome c3 family protein [Rhodopirellula sp. JC740]|uniref:Cytochrome c3 family protein n=1 Tax=Rhodopirellula halodulae TaxID=2894198 RepID=A0ABS8NM47_9BACT|nr:cytochrome c3 family protein [Rhodopirellula sp. JC740]MCC9644586.1 cytochrome c3 family protein [Rhodopirellula sp. JC740]